MLPKTIIVDNFSSYIHEEIEFEKFGDIFALVGDNGAGKSSIIDMITVSIFFRVHGTDAKGSGMEELIHKGTESFKIDYTFNMNGQDYRIIREKFKKGGQALQFFINGEDHTGKLAETQSRVLNTLKMDYDTFMDTVIIGQGESANFMKKSATERKKVIAQIMRLDKYEILESYTKDLKRQLEGKIKLMETQMNNLFDSIKNKDSFNKELKEIKSELSTIETFIAKKDKELEKEVIEKTKYDELKKQQESILNRKRIVISSITNVDTEKVKHEGLKVIVEKVLADKDITLGKIEVTVETILQCSDEEKELNAKHTTLETENKILLENINELKGKFIQLKQYNDCKCKFCGQQITGEHKDQHLKELKQQGVEKQNIYNNNAEKIKLIEDKKFKIKNELLQYNINLNQLNQYKTKIDQAEIKIESVNSKLLDLRTRMEELIEEKNEIDKINVDVIDNRLFNDTSIRRELQNLRNSLSTKTSRISVLENELKNIANDEKKYLKNKEEYDNMRESVEIYDDLQKAWSKNGIQAIIIDNILPQIEEEINRYLKILSGDKISIRFETQKEAKNGNKSETLDIIVNDSKGSRSYERYSGGEKTRIDFACHIGMSKFLAKRSGANIDFFVIDEGIGTLDEAGKDNFIDTVKLLNTIFKQVMIISHIPDIKEAFDNKILITKDIFEGSKVSIIA